MEQDFCNTLVAHFYTYGLYITHFRVLFIRQDLIKKAKFPNRKL